MKTTYNHLLNAIKEHGHPHSEGSFTSFLLQLNASDYSFVTLRNNAVVFEPVAIVDEEHDLAVLPREFPCNSQFGATAVLQALEAWFLNESIAIRIDSAVKDRLTFTEIVSMEIAGGTSFWLVTESEDMFTSDGRAHEHASRMPQAKVLRCIEPAALSDSTNATHAVSKNQVFVKESGLWQCVAGRDKDKSRATLDEGHFIFVRSELGS